MVVVATEQVSPGCIKITVQAGPSFFIRTLYLRVVKPEQIVPGGVFDGEAEQDIVDAGFTYSAEAKAVAYLARAEQSRAGLTRKLTAKKIEKQYIERALDYLEGVSYLSDARFARAWLNTRKIGHAEGRTRLAAELAARGIGRETASDALDSFFAENSEDVLCERALKKLLRRAMTKDAAVQKLMQQGFSYKCARDMCTKYEETGVSFLK